MNSCGSRDWGPSQVPLFNRWQQEKCRRSRLTRPLLVPLFRSSAASIGCLLRDVVGAVPVLVRHHGIRAAALDATVVTCFQGRRPPGTRRGTRTEEHHDEHDGCQAP